MNKNVETRSDIGNPRAFLRLWVVIWLPLVALTIPAAFVSLRLNRWFGIIVVLENLSFLVVAAIIGRRHRRKLMKAPAVSERGHILPNVHTMRRHTLIVTAAIVLVLINLAAGSHASLTERTLIGLAVLAPPTVIWLVLAIANSRQNNRLAL